MSRKPSLSTKLGAIGGLLLLMALASIGLTPWVTWQLEGGAAAVDEAGRMRMQTCRLAQTLAAGDSAPLQSRLDRFDQTLALLRNGDPSRPLLIPRDAESQRSFDHVQQGWQALRARWAAVPAPTAAEAALQAATHVGPIDASVTAIVTAIESLRAGALKREAAVAQGRGLLARELHDSIAQGLSFQKIQVGLLRDALPRQSVTPAERALDELDAAVRESLSDVRELPMHFRTRTHGEDIEPALRTTLQKFEHQTGLSTHFTIEGDAMPLPPDVQMQVLHAVQEALSKVRKLAQARAVWVEVQQAPQWRVDLRNDGRGFAPGAAEADETHVGLRIMRERALDIAETRVKIHVQHSLRKLEPSSRVQVAVPATARTG